MIQSRGFSALIAAASFAFTSFDAWASGPIKLHGDSNRSILVASPSLYPEGIDHNSKTGEFLLGSIRSGKVVAIAPDGKVRTVISDDRLVSVVGIRVDPARGRVHVTNSDYGVAERSVEASKFVTAALGIYDLETGKSIHFVDLSQLLPGEKHFINDVAVDSAGNAYATDSLAAAIYKITPDGMASVFLANERFRGQGFSMNGIQFHPGGYLLVGKKSDGALFKVPLEQPEKFSQVELPRPLVGQDGLVLASPTELVAITNRIGSNAYNKAYRLVSSDDWASARVEGETALEDGYATTGTIKDGRLFVSHGWLHTLPAMLAEKKPLIDTFKIVELGAK